MTNSNSCPLIDQNYFFVFLNMPIAIGKNFRPVSKPFLQKKRIMKTHFKLIVALIVIVTIGACESDDIEPAEGQNGKNFLKKIYYENVIKSYEPEIALKWDEALGLAVDNKMGQSAQARIYAMVTLAMHDALNNIVPQYEIYALPHNYGN